MRELRKGKRINTVSGEMYQHHDVWIPLFEQNMIEEISSKFELDENHVIGKIVEQWIGEQVMLKDRINFFTSKILPKIKEKYSKENFNGKSKE